MDYENLNADVDEILTEHFSSGREGNSIQMVVIHHNAGDLTIEDCYNVWQNREASAHYQVESSGRIGQLVWDHDTAWHAGDWDTNLKSIGVEHADQGDGVSDACIENGSHLVAALCKNYGLGRPEWLVNVFPHSHFAATACPGPLSEGTSYHDRYMARAGEWYDIMTGAAPDVPVNNDKAVPVQLYDPNGTDAQRFAVSWDKDGYATLKSVSCGLALDVSRGSSDSGAAVQVYTPNGSDAQKWRTAQKSGQYAPDYSAPVALIPKVNENLRLDCVNGGKTAGTRLQTYYLNDTGAQQWQILDHGDGTWTLINVASSKALDVVGGGN